nr:2-amino-4-hydroxy-6-hydroxymethyldihydropteridine diphosphokinase [Neobacillus terrae]
MGSNMGDRFCYLKMAVQSLKYNPKIKLVNCSSIYETDPVGYEDQDLFLNMAVEVKTVLTAQELLEVCLAVELELGRKREIKWGPRTIDLDILLYNQENIETETLIIPHPRMQERAFVMVPLFEIAENASTLPFSLEKIPESEGVRIWKRKNGEDVFELTES